MLSYSVIYALLNSLTHKTRYYFYFYSSIQSDLCGEQSHFCGTNASMRHNLCTVHNGFYHLFMRKTVYLRWITHLPRCDFASNLHWIPSMSVFRCCVDSNNNKLVKWIAEISSGCSLCAKENKCYDSWHSYRCRRSICNHHYLWLKVRCPGACRQRKFTHFICRFASPLLLIAFRFVLWRFLSSCVRCPVRFYCPALTLSSIGWRTKEKQQQQQKIKWNDLSVACGIPRPT